MITGGLCRIFAENVPASLVDGLLAHAPQNLALQLVARKAAGGQQLTRRHRRSLRASDRAGRKWHRRQQGCVVHSSAERPTAWLIPTHACTVALVLFPADPHSELVDFSHANYTYL